MSGENAERAMPLLIRADARALPLPDESVDLVVTSPPYYGLRSYTDGGAHYDGQLGAEATPTDYLDALLSATREWARVLKPSGSLFVNLGDKYSGAQAQNHRHHRRAITSSEPDSHGRSRRRSPDPAPSPAPSSAPCSAEFWRRTDPARTGIPSKSLMLLPERYRVRCVDELRLIARAVIVWSKPNGLPESVTDRVRRGHEDWVHLTKNPRYYSAVDHIREPARRDRDGPPGGGGYYTTRPAGTRNTNLPTAAPHPLGRLPGSVWTVPTTGLRLPPELGVRHFAAFPPELPRRIILGWSPREVCTACGQGRAPVTDRSERLLRRPDGIAHLGKNMEESGTGPRTVRSSVGGGIGEVETLHRITGYACACPDTHAPTTPGVVLDPCSGTGTTALVAALLGRVGIGIDRSADYCRLAGWRAHDPTQRARARAVRSGARPDHRTSRHRPSRRITPCPQHCADTSTRDQESHDMTAGGLT